MRSSTIKQLRLNYTFVVAIILILAYTMFVYVNLRKSINDVEWIKKSEEFQEHLEAMVSQIKDAEAAQRGFLITGDEVQIAPYYTAKENVYSSLEEAKKLALGNPEQLERLSAVRKIIKERFKNMEQVTKVDSLGTMSNEFMKELLRDGNLLMSEMRTRVNEIERADDRLLRERTEDLENSSNDVLFQSILFGVITFIIVVVAFFKISHDLKKRIRSESQLQASNYKFQALFDQSFQMVGMTDEEGNIIDANKPALEFLMVDKEEIKGKSFVQIVGRMLDHKGRETLKRAVEIAKDGEFFRIDLPTVSPDGKKATIDFSLKPFYDESGNISLLIAEGRDVTELYKITEALAESREIYDLVLRGSSAGIWDWTDVSQDEIWWSPKFLDLIGYDLKEIQPSLSLFKKLLHPADVDQTLEELYAALHNDKSYEVEYRLKHKSGEYRWFHATGQAIWDSKENPVRMAGSIIDITERKRAEAAFHSVAQLMIAAENIARIGSFEWNMKNDEVIWSEGMYKIYNLESQYVTPSYDFMTRHIVKEDLEETQSIIKEARETKMPYQLNYRIRVNGTLKHLKELATVKEDENGNFEGFIGTVRDNTNEVLAAKRINEAMEELERSNEELEQFAYVASHDLQEPLRKIRAFGDRLLSKFSSKGEELPGQEYVDRMQNAAERMQVLIDDLLTFSRVSRGQQRVEPVDLQRIFEEVSTDLSIQVSGKKGILKQVKELPNIMGSPTQMRQLFQNILGNAIKFSKEDTPPKVEIEYSVVDASEVFSHEKNPVLENNKYHRILIRDNGIGFEEEYLEKIFTIFQRLHGKSEFKGTGIGLAVCKKIVENHNGILTARSKPGEGAEFYIFLPDHL